MKQGYRDRIALLLTHNISTNEHNHYDKRPHLKNAELADHVEITALLLQHGTAPAALSTTKALHTTYLHTNETKKTKSTAQPIEKHNDLGTLLATTEHEQLQTIHLILNLEIPIDRTNTENLTALHVTTTNEHRLIVDELLTHSTSLELHNRIHHGTPLERIT